MLRKLTFTLAAAFSAAAFAQGPMQDTWDTNAPNGAPMALGQPLSSSAASSLITSGPMQDTWDTNAPNGAPMQVTAPASPNTHTAVHGHAVKAAVAQRVIVVQPGTTSVNVRDGETVLFKVGERSFAWTFEPTLLHASFGLAEIAPVGIDVRGVTVYCEPTPYERAG